MIDFRVLKRLESLRQCVADWKLEVIEHLLPPDTAIQSGVGLTRIGSCSSRAFHWLSIQEINQHITPGLLNLLTLHRHGAVLINSSNDNCEP